MSGNIESILNGPWSPPAPEPPEAQLRHAISNSGMRPPAQIIMDGNIHRFRPDDKEGDSAWYIAYGDNIPAGSFGDWRNGTSSIWVANIGRELTSVEIMQNSMRLSEAKKRHDEERAIKNARAAEGAKAIWDNAGMASEEYPYLQRKGIKSHCSRMSGDGRIVLPLYNANGEFSTIQYIDTDGTKLYHTGGATKGCFHILGVPENKIYLAEGFATAATIYETTGVATAIAYSAGNLVPVAGSLREKYPSASLVIVADNDKSGTGKNYADQASAKYGAAVIMPPDIGDANDFKQAGGDLLALLTPQSETWLTPIDDWCSQPAPIKWLVRGWVQENALVMVHGPSGGGKTFVVLDMVLRMASGHGEWMGCKTKKCPVVYLAGEGHHGLRARIAAWMQHHGKKPGNMWVSRSAVDLNTPAGLSKAMSYIKELPEIPKIIVVDTLHRFLDGDENSAQDSKTMIDACAIIQREFSATVLLVHHTGVNDAAQGRGRGSSSWRGALENEISIQPKDDVINIEAMKIKDAEKPAPMVVALSSVEIDGWIDEDGIQVKSAIIIKSDDEISQKKDKKIEAPMRSIEGAWWDSGCEIIDGNPYISKSAWTRHMIEREGKSESSAKQYVKPAAEGKPASVLIYSGIIAEHGSGYVIIDGYFASKLMISR